MEILLNNCDNFRRRRRLSSSSVVRSVVVVLLLLCPVLRPSVPSSVPVRLTVRPSAPSSSSSVRHRRRPTRNPRPSSLRFGKHFLVGVDGRGVLDEVIVT